MTTPRLSPLFDALLAEKGSDLHLSIGHPPLGRIRGELTPLREAPLTASEVEALLFELLSPEQKHQLTEAMDLDFSYSYGTKARFRANCFHKVTGLAAVFRPLPGKVPSLAELSVPEAVRKLAERRGGLVLVTGPKGSGRSTTLAAMVHHINQTRHVHILTLEEPVEFIHEPAKAQVTQREVGPHAASFAAALRSAEREDANVVHVGELCTPETIRQALELADAGVLVLASAHTLGASATIERLLSAFPEEEQPGIRGRLADNLAGILSQQLVRTADGKGRVVAMEVLLGGGAIAALIREGNLSPLAGKSQPLDQHLEKLVAAGTVAPEAALEKAQDREAFTKTLQRLKPGFVPPATSTPVPQS
ncbi:type IV pilus twitching motility protein PilT [Hyalangium rubrum]|uniref:PilT/PilU family type 4a pilus ATPase n=1 Tax=Hyalangium rubrum TaxID=3103134 RepID=A0ABU5H4I6_9BACT|nr:PilT/PilU family type 4a pilus ATPase [Hyalangium sp. s54d21]MDY7227697.1 PilT/PilU family type 4a pilus ATPase [Hyalangium sp. s54d21]